MLFYLLYTYKLSSARISLVAMVWICFFRQNSVLVKVLACDYGFFERMDYWFGLTGKICSNQTLNCVSKLIGLVSLMTFWMVLTCPEGSILKICWNLFSLKELGTPSKIDDICRVLAGVYDDGAMFKIWLKSDEFEGIKNSLKDWW